MILRLYTVYNKHEMIKTGNQTEKIPMYYRKCSYTFAADWTYLKWSSIEQCQWRKSPEMTETFWEASLDTHKDYASTQLQSFIP